jgi:hypothetical protein
VPELFTEGYFTDQDPPETHTMILVTGATGFIGRRLFSDWLVMPVCGFAFSSDPEMTQIACRAELPYIRCWEA